MQYLLQTYTFGICCPTNKNKMATKSGYVHPEWLDEKFMERALREGEADPDIVVKHIQVKAATAVGDNYVGLMYRVYVEFVGKGGSRDKQSFIVKALPVEQTARKLIIETNLFSTESTMYKKTIPDMERLLQGANPERYRQFSPKRIYLAPKPDETLVLEDLSVSGFKMAERLQGLDLDHSKLAFQRLAMFHAASVALAEKDPSSMVCYETDVYSENILLKSFFTNAIKSTIEEVNTWPGYSEKYSHKLLKLSETLFENVIENRKRISGDLNVLNHGDAWLNNMMFKYSETGEVIDHRFVDYQLAYYGSPVIDLHYMLSTTPSPQVKVNHYEDLLLEYHSTLCDTLTSLGFAHKAPLYSDLKQELDKKEMFAFLTMCSVLPKVLADTSKENDTVENNLDDNKKPSVHYSEIFKTEIKRILPLLEKKSLLCE